MKKSVKKNKKGGKSGIAKKEINLPQRFNSGIGKFEPELPVKNRGSEKINLKVNWWKFILFMIIAIVIIGATIISYIWML